MNRKLLLTLFQDSPGVVTAANNNTYPQFAVHIAIEGNNTFVMNSFSLFHSTPIIVQFSHMDLILIAFCLIYFIILCLCIMEIGVYINPLLDP